MMARRLGGLFLILLPLVGCGIPVDEGARPLSDDDVRPSLPGQGASPPSVSASPNVASLELFFVRDSRMVPIRRLAPASSIDAAVAALVNGPSAAERRQGVRTALVGPVRLADIDRTAVPVVDVADSVVQLEGEEQILALAQIVFTLTALPGVSGVSFALSGREVEVPTGDGTLKAGPLRREDFAAVGPVG